MRKVRSYKMTNLTEQWNKGELPNGWYYLRLIRGEYRIDLYINGKNEWIDCPDNIIDTVVCEVPSYEEWQALEASYEMSTDANLKQATWMVDMEKENTKLKKQLAHVTRTQAKQFRDNQKLQVRAERAKDVVNINTAREIKRLKELLKEWLLFEEEENPKDFTVMSERLHELAQQTNKLLGKE